MKSKPMLFSAPMVRALLEGRKTQTRRTRGLEDVAKYPGRLSGEGPMGPLGYRGLCESDLYIKDKRDFKRNPLAYHWFLGHQPGEVNPIPVKCPHPVGSEIWVRETWNGTQGEGVAYRATEPHMNGEPWRPSIFMPRWASRITLTVTDVRVQRLQDISEEDAISEGILEDGAGFSGFQGASWQRNPEDAYRNLWESINGPGSWDANPFVWAYTFEVKR